LAKKKKKKFHASQEASLGSKGKKNQLLGLLSHVHMTNLIWKFGRLLQGCHARI